MNSLQLIGRLTKDPELMRANESGLAYCNFNIAIARRSKNPESKEADFPRLVAFGKTAENMTKYLKKGSLICVEGCVRTGSFEKDGKTKFTTELVANSVQFLSKNFEKDKPPEGLITITDDDVPF